MTGVEAVELTAAERALIAKLARVAEMRGGAVTGVPNLESVVTIEEARQIARKEIASLAGLVLKRLQESHPTRSFERNAADDIVRERLMSIFAEVLADFGGHTGDGEEPGA